MCTSFYQKTSSTARSSVQNEDSEAKKIYNKVKAANIYLKEDKLRKNFQLNKLVLWLKDLTVFK